jgi:transposase-like protein
MSQAISVRTDYSIDQVRFFAKRAKSVAQARRLLAIAAVLEGASRTEAARIGGMDRQTLRDWVIRFNEKGSDGLISGASPGGPVAAFRAGASRRSLYHRSLWERMSDLS